MHRRLREYLGWPRWRLVWMSAVVLIGGGTLIGVLNHRAYHSALWWPEVDAPWNPRQSTRESIGDGPHWPEQLAFFRNPTFLQQLEGASPDGKYTLHMWENRFVLPAFDEITATSGHDRTTSRIVISGTGGAMGVQFRIVRHRWGAPLRWAQDWRVRRRQGEEEQNTAWRDIDIGAAAANIVACFGVFGLPLFGPTLYRSLRRRRQGRCPACGYDLRGDLAQGCTECGWRRDDEPDPIAATDV